MWDLHSSTKIDMVSFQESYSPLIVFDFFQKIPKIVYWTCLKSPHLSIWSAKTTLSIATLNSQLPSPKSLVHHHKYIWKIWVFSLSCFIFMLKLSFSTFPWKSIASLRDPSLLSENKSLHKDWLKECNYNYMSLTHISFSSCLSLHS